MFSLGHIGKENGIKILFMLKKMLCFSLNTIPMGYGTNPKVSNSIWLKNQFD